MELNEITRRVLAAAVAVHRKLGPGLLESAYQAALEFEMPRQGLRFKRELEVPLVYDGVRIGTGYRLDFLVEDKVVVELKAVETMIPLFTAQTLTYMRLGNYPVGLLINFNVPYLGDGAVKRLVNGYEGPRPTES